MWMRETAWEWGRWRRRRRRRSWTVTYNEGGASVSLSFSLSPSPSSLSLFAFLLCLFCFSYLSAPPSPSSTCIFSLPCSICGGTCNVHLHRSTEMFQLDFFFFFFFSRCSFSVCASRIFSFTVGVTKHLCFSPWQTRTHPVSCCMLLSEPDRLYLLPDILPHRRYVSMGL